MTKFRDKLKLKGLKMVDLARICGVSPSTLSDMDSARKRLPSYGLAYKIHKEIGLPMEYWAKNLPLEEQKK